MYQPRLRPKVVPPSQACCNCQGAREGTPEACRAKPAPFEGACHGTSASRSGRMSGDLRLEVRKHGSADQPHCQGACQGMSACMSGCMPRQNSLVVRAYVRGCQPVCQGADQGMPGHMSGPMSVEKVTWDVRRQCQKASDGECQISSQAPDILSTYLKLAVTSEP